MNEQIQGRETRAYELLKKARDLQGLPLKASSSLKYTLFDDRVTRGKESQLTGNHGVQEYDSSGYDEECFVEQRGLMGLPEREFRIANAYFKNDRGLSGNSIYEKLARDKPSFNKRPDGYWAVQSYYLGKLKARTLTEEEYNFVLKTPIMDLYTQTLKKFEEMEDFPLEAKLEMGKNEHLTINPLTLGLANLRTLRSFKDWIAEDEKSWEEKKPLLEAELTKIKGLQKLATDSTERQRYRYPWSAKHDLSRSEFDRQLMDWCNHESQYVYGRAFVERDASSPRTGNERIHRIPKSTFDYFQDPVYYRLSGLGLYMDRNPNKKGVKAIKRFAEEGLALIRDRRMKEKEYNAILDLKTDEEFLDLAVRRGRRIKVKQKRISRKPLYISPLTMNLLYCQIISLLFQS